MAESEQAREKRIKRQKEWYAKQDPARLRAMRAASYRKHREKRIADSRAWALANPDSVRKSNRAWRENNKERFRALNTKSRLKCKYGMTVEQWHEMFDAQGRVCKCCSSPDPYASNGWHVDHCHETGLVRGILCQQCNIMLGAARDEPKILMRGVAYLALS